MHVMKPGKANSVIRIIRSDDKAQVTRVFSHRAQRLDEAERTVSPILAAVKREGDRALVRFAKRWDGFTGTAPQLAVSAKDIARARDAVGENFLRAVRDAAWNIREFCNFQMPRSWQRRIRPGIEVGQLVRPLESVGCYIPGGRYPLPSTLLMTAIPAQVTGVERVVVCTPRPNDEIFATASELGVTEIYTLGGAHAIAALAYGTKTIRPVSKIVGPGNAYVAAAKRLVSRDTAIDFVAGPTEVLLIANDGDPAWIASDLLAQAEHDVDATALLLTPSAKLAREVAAAVRGQLSSFNGTPAAVSLKKNCAIVIVRDLKEAVLLANRFAPEHLSVPAELALDSVHNAGSVFIGPFSPEAAGDYASGPNHVLPTGGMARLRGGLSVLDYVKVVSVQKLTESGLRSIAPTIVNLARSEGLEAHARSVEIRLEGKANSPQRTQRARRKTEN